MTDLPAQPRLRSLEAFPARVDGQDVIGLRDPSGLTEALLAVPVHVAPVLALLDGTRSLLDVQAEIMRRSGTLVPRDDLEALVATLDQCLFLDGPRLEDARARGLAAFRARPTRHAAHAGKAYAGEAEHLARELDGFFTQPGGPGPIGPRRGTTVSGLVAPHIDFHRGGAAYAWAYRAVAEAAAADCVIVLGTAHAGLDGQPAAATAKAYETPFGPLAVDREVLEALGRRTPFDLFAAEAAHRSEHSIEFQAVCLRYLHRKGDGVRIVPLLVSFGQECLAQGVDPADHPAVAAFLDALGAAMASVPRRYCLVAGADLAHVGPRFGDRSPVSPADLRRVEAADRGLLEHVARRDPRGFFAEVARVGDAFRICGLSPVYAVLHALPPHSRGRLLRYAQWHDPAGAVTFASVAFEEPPA